MNYTQAAVTFSLLYSRFAKAMDRALSAHGLSLTEYLVLNTLATNPNHTCRRIDLADTVGLSASGVTRLLNPLEKIHLVEKEAALRDARVSLVRLSKAGAILHKDASTTLDRSMETFIHTLSTEEQSIFQQCFQS